MKTNEVPFNENIFIDTSIFEDQNFFHGSKIRSLLHYSNIGFISLFMTTISKMELINRMRTRLENCKTDYNKLIKELNNHEQRILKNIDIYDQIHVPLITVDSGLQKLINKLETNISANKIKLIDTENLIAEEVFDRYYKNQPPFGPGKKKYEFPDAFIVLSLESWCKKNKKRMLFLTKDTDFHKFKSRHLIFYDNLTELLQSITVKYDSFQETHILPTIKQLLSKYNKELIQEIENQIQEKIILKTDYEKTGNFKIDKMELISDKVTAIRDKYAEVELMIKITSSMTVFPSAQDIDRSIFEDKISKHKIVKQNLVPVDIEVFYTEEQTIKIKWINSNDPVIIEYY